MVVNSATVTQSWPRLYLVEFGYGIINIYIDANLRTQISPYSYLSDFVWTSNLRLICTCSTRAYQFLFQMNAEDLSSLSVFLATQEQIVEARKRGWLNWGRGRTTEEQFLQWYARGDHLEHVSNGKMATWCSIIATLVKHELMK
jgi:hypothetical protein